MSDVSGFDRGTPIDRYYIERFLAAHAKDVRGRVLEVGNDRYSRQFGGRRIDSQDILAIDAANSAATIIGDLSKPGILTADSFDCVILTQTLQYLFDVPTALKQIRGALRPGGVLLLTAPGVAPVSLDDWRESYYWRFTASAIECLLGALFDPGKIEVRSFGNLYAATAFLHGAAAEETDKAELQPVMPEYAVVIAARAVA